MAAGGSKGELAIWDVEEAKACKEYFKGSKVKKAGENAEEMDDGADSGFEDVSSEEEKPKKKKKSKK